MILKFLLARGSFDQLFCEYDVECLMTPPIVLSQISPYDQFKIHPVLPN